MRETITNFVSTIELSEEEKDGLIDNIEYIMRLLQKAHHLWKTADFSQAFAGTAVLVKIFDENKDELFSDPSGPEEFFLGTLYSIIGNEHKDIRFRLLDMAETSDLALRILAYAYDEEMN